MIISRHLFDDDKERTREFFPCFFGLKGRNAFHARRLYEITLTRYN